MRSALERVIAAWAFLGGLILLAIVLVTTTNAGAFTIDKIARLFGGTVSGLPGYEDFVRLAISAAGLMFFPYCQLKRGHIAVDILARKISLAGQKTLDVVSFSLTAILAGFLGCWMVLGMAETYADGALSRVLGWPEWPFYLPGVASLFLWAAIAVTQIFTTDRDVRA